MSLTPGWNQPGGRRHLAVEGVVLGGVLLMLGALWLPWHHSGSRARNAFELLSAAEELGLGPSVLRSAWHWLLPAVPALSALVWIAMVLGRRRLRLAAVVAVAVVVGAGATVVLASDDSSGAGAAVAVIGLVVSSVGLIGSQLIR